MAINHFIINYIRVNVQTIPVTLRVIFQYSPPNIHTTDINTFTVSDLFMRFLYSLYILSFSDLIENIVYIYIYIYIWHDHMYS